MHNRLPLYPALQDHDLVKNYPPVQGIAKNVFFLTHKHKENGGEDESVSKFNAYEVGLIDHRYLDKSNRALKSG